MAPLADLYHLTMAYALWRTGRHRDPAAAELFFRREPFGAAFAVGAGLGQALRSLGALRFSAAGGSVGRGDVHRRDWGIWGGGGGGSRQWDLDWERGRHAEGSRVFGWDVGRRGRPCRGLVVGTRGDPSGRRGGDEDVPPRGSGGVGTALRRTGELLEPPLRGIRALRWDVGTSLGGIGGSTESCGAVGQPSGGLRDRGLDEAQGHPSQGPQRVLYVIWVTWGHPFRTGDFSRTQGIQGQP